MELASALLLNKHILMDPYVGPIVPPVLTCLVGRRLGSSTDPLAHYPLRNTAAALLGSICKRFAKSSRILKPRLARSCLKHFLDPTKPLGANYGGIIGLQAVGGTEVVRALILPNVKEYESLIREPLEDEGSPKNAEAEAVLTALVWVLQTLEDETPDTTIALQNGDADAQRGRLEEKIGPLLAGRILAMGRPKFVKTLLEA